MDLIVEGLNRKCAPLAALEQARTDGTLARLVARAVREGASEWVGLMTCSRVELCSVRPGAPRAQGSGAPPLLLSGEEAVRHLLAVAAGLESELLGESAVQAQVRRAWVDACRAQTTGPVLACLYPQVLRAARAVRVRLGFERGRRDWPEVLLDQFRRDGRSLPATQVVLVGQGSLGEALARAFTRAGAQVVRAGNHASGPETSESCSDARSRGCDDGTSPGRSDKSARVRSDGRSGGTPATAELRALLPHCRLLVCASGRGRLLSAADLRACEPLRRTPEALEIWDLAVPRNIDPSARRLPWVLLRTEEDLGDPTTRKEDAILRARGLEWIAEDAARILADIAVGAIAGDTARRGAAVSRRAFESRDPLRRATPGLVSLVGAGPGDPSLLTRAAIERLERADVILYDALLPAALLATLPIDARWVPVGGRAGRTRLGQAEIERRMIDEARAGRHVVRLKGGDPFVFGRGGEEIAALDDAGVSWEAIPGVTAACGAAAAFGIPLTHRAESHGVRFVAATLAGGDAFERSDTGNGASVAGASTETIVAYMAGRRLAPFARALLESGHAPATPAALISRATWADSACLRATLAELASGASCADERGPSLLVIGPAAARARSPMRPKRPRVAVAALLQELPEIASALRDSGLDVLEIPLARLAPAGRAPVSAAIHRLRDFATVRFEDPHAVGPFFAALREAGRDLRDLAGIRLEAVGAATARTIEARGLRPDSVIVSPVGAGPAGGAPNGIPARPRAALMLRGAPEDDAPPALGNRRARRPEADEGDALGDGVRRLTLGRVVPHWPDLHDLEADWRARPPEACLVQSGFVVEPLVAALGPFLESVPVYAPRAVLRRLRGRALRLRACESPAELSRFLAVASDAGGEPPAVRRSTRERTDPRDTAALQPSPLRSPDDEPAIHGPSRKEG